MRIFRKLAQLLDVNVGSVSDGDALVYDQATEKWIPGAGGGGGGAPTTVDYLVGTASGSLSAEIAVGTTPGGELGGTWASPTVDATHSGSSHASVQAAAEATAAAALSAHASDTTGIHGISDTSALETSAGAQAKVDTHVNDTTDAHDASAISVNSATLSGTGTDVQASLEEIDNLLDDHSARHENGGADEISIAGLDGTPTELTNHLNDTSAAHAASAISADSTTLVGTGTDVQAVLEELDNGIADHLADTSAAHAASAISFSPTGTIAATDVQAAIAEVASEAGGGGGQVAYAEFTANVTISATTPATANTVVTAPAFTASAVPYRIEFACPVLTPGGGGGGLVPMLYLDGSAVGGVGGLTTAQVIGSLVFVHTPSAGSRTYSIRFYRTTSNGTVEAGDGTGTNFRPGFIRVSPA